MSLGAAASYVCRSTNQSNHPSREASGRCDQQKELGGVRCQESE